MAKLVDLTGHRFGRLLVLARSPLQSRRVTWVCQCDCGETVTVLAVNLGRGTNSCGCLRKDSTRELKTTHGCKSRNAPTPEYQAWVQMLTRCRNPARPDRKNYLDRGITVCVEWSEHFEAFLQDMGPKPGREYTLERIDNNTGYYKENCKWATRKEQSCNRRNNLVLYYRGKSVKLVDIAKQLNLSPKHTKAIRQRISRGWDADSAVDTPL